MRIAQRYLLFFSKKYPGHDVILKFKSESGDLLRLTSL
jgi:hypothetical protein